RVPPRERHENQPPELVLDDVPEEAVGTLAIGRDREPQPSRRSDRMKVDFLLGELAPADPHDAPVLQRILHREETGEEAGLVAERVEAAEVDASGARLDR